MLGANSKALSQEGAWCVGGEGVSMQPAVHAGGGAGPSGRGHPFLRAVTLALSGTQNLWEPLRKAVSLLPRAVHTCPHLGNVAHNLGASGTHEAHHGA